MNVRVDRVTVGYNDGPSIVKDVSFNAEPGKVTTLLGPNGCGKSTLLKTLSRLLAPTEGQVLAQEKDVHSLRAREAAQLIALLPQHPLCPAGLTLENSWNADVTLIVDRSGVGERRRQKIKKKCARR